MDSNVGIATPAMLHEASEKALVRGEQPYPRIEALADGALLRAGILRLRGNAGDLPLKLLLLQLQHREEALKPLKGVRLRLQFRLRELDLCH